MAAKTTPSPVQQLALPASVKGSAMHPPVGMSTFEFVVVSSLRAAQLTRGCTPRIESTHKIIMTAQMEVAERKVVRAADISVVALEMA